MKNKGKRAAQKCKFIKLSFLCISIKANISTKFSSKQTFLVKKFSTFPKIALKMANRKFCRATVSFLYKTLLAYMPKK